MDTPEYLAVSRNRHDLERRILSCLNGIAAKLRDSGAITSERHDAIVASKNDGAKLLVTDVLLSLEDEPVEVYIEFINVLKSSGNRTFKKFIDETIESKRKMLYRDLLKHSGKSGPSSYDVFISYSREPETNATVDQISDRLKQEGLKVFVDRSNINPGKNWPATIVDAINSCKAFIVVLTKKYVRSIYCNGELFEAEALGKTFFPIQYEAGWDDGPAGVAIKAVISRIQHVELKPGEEVSDHFVQIILGKCGKPQSSSGSQTTALSEATDSSSADCRSQASVTGGKRSRGTEDVEVPPSSKRKCSNLEGEDTPLTSAVQLESSRRSRKLLKDSPSRSQLPEVSTLADTSKLLDALFPARTKWFNIGLLLNVFPETLEAIRIKCREDSNDCLRETLLCRLEKEPLTFGDIIHTLQQRTVGHNALAKELQNSHSFN